MNRYRHFIKETSVVASYVDNIENCLCASMHILRYLPKIYIQQIAASEC